MSARDHPGSQRLEIRKYPNRRYYDTTGSQHLTLDEIRSLIQEGHDLRVVDSKTSSDITPQVLTQIILDLDTQKLDSFPVPLLMRVIRVNDQLVKDFIEKYFNQALHSFLDYQQQFEERLREVHGLPAVYPTVSAWTKAMLEPFTAAFGSDKQRAGEAAEAPSGKTEELRALIKDLQGQVAKLRQNRPSQRPKKQPRKAKRRA